MAAPNVNGRLHLTGVHQKPPASLFREKTVCRDGLQTPE